MENKMLNGVGFSGEVRFFIVNSTSLAKEVEKQTQIYPISLIALMNSLSITGIMGTMLKGKEQITTIIDGDGPCGKIIVNAQSNGNVKGLVSNRYVDLPLVNDSFDIVGGVGNIGNIQVIKDLGLKMPYTSETSIIKGDISSDFSYYFTYSEQTATAIASGVLINQNLEIESSGAVVIQVLPNVSEEVIVKLEEKLTTISNISKLIKENTLEKILSLVFNDDFEILEERNLTYNCTCDEKKYINAINLLNEKELLEIKKEKTIECVCDYCHKIYNIETKKINKEKL